MAEDIKPQWQTPYHGSPPCAEESCNHLQWQHYQGYCVHCERVCLPQGEQYSYIKIKGSISASQPDRRSYF